MKNPFLLFFIWLLFFLLEILFPWEFAGVSLKPFGSFFLLGYAFFILPLLPSFLFAALAFAIQSSYSNTPFQLLFLITVIGLAVFWLRRKTFSENLAAKAIAVCLVLFLGLYSWEALDQGSVSSPFLNISAVSILIIQGIVTLTWAIFLFWLLEEPGSLWEERLLSFRAKKGQLHLFEARHLRQIKRSRFRVQARVRRRFGLRDSW